MCVHVCARPLAHLREDTPDMLPAASRKEREMVRVRASTSDRIFPRVHGKLLVLSVLENGTVAPSTGVWGREDFSLSRNFRRRRSAEVFALPGAGCGVVVVCVCVSRISCVVRAHIHEAHTHKRRVVKLSAFSDNHSLSAPPQHTFTASPGASF